MSSGHDRHFKWDTLVPHIVHPVKVAVIEAMQWIGEPLSPRELDLLFEEELGLPLVSYHVRALADMGAVEAVRQKQVRGALQTYYVLTEKEPADWQLACE
jgi:hypothetical protein